MMDSDPGKVSVSGRRVDIPGHCVGASWSPGLGQTGTAIPGSVYSVGGCESEEITTEQ